MKAVVIWISLAILGIALAVGGVLAGWVIKPMVLHNKLNLNKENSEGFENFMVPPVDVIIKFYLFEVTNPDEVSAGTEIPDLRERGPYTFREERNKDNLTRPSDQFLEFGQLIGYTFAPELSCDGCQRNDSVTILNMPLIGLIDTGVTMGGFLGGILIGIIEGAIEAGDIVGEIFFTVNVGEFLFDGVKNELVSWMPTQSLLKNKIPPVFKDEKFAIFNGKVDTSDNECYQVETSSESWDRHTMITKYGHNKDELMDSLATMETLSTNGNGLTYWWSGPDSYGNTGNESVCNELKGTDGQQFPPGVDKTQRLHIFNTAPCRSVYMEYVEDMDVEGVPTYNYAVPSDAANVNKVDNFCACEELSKCPECDGNTITTDCFMRMEDDPETLDISMCEVNNCHDGLQDISVCQGAPTFLSFPHFLLAPDQVSKFTGLSPNSEKHKNYLNVEPNTGMTVNLHQRIQLNTPLPSQELLPGGKTMKMLETVKAITAFPVVWLDQGADIEDDPDMVKHLKSQLKLLNIADISKWALIGVGIGLTILSSLAAARSCRSTSV